MAINLVQGKQIATASWAINAISSSYSQTASFATNALTASYLEGYISPFPFTGSAQITGSLEVTGSIVATQGFTGSFSGSGANLFDIPASGIVGLNLSQIISGSVSASISPNDGLQINTNVTATSFTGSLFGTSSWATNSISSSYPLAITGSTIRSTYVPGGIGGNTTNSIFIGSGSGESATSANNSNFLGRLAGRLATNASNSNFFGNSAGSGSTGASNSNFVGQQAGALATSAFQSNFIGLSAGQNATNAHLSNIIGSAAGQNATNASYSTLVGYQAGYSINSANSIGSNNIIIGTNITLASQRKDSINLGGVIFATGSYSNTGTNPYSGSQIGIGRVGINVVNPSYTLEVGGTVAFPNIPNTSHPDILYRDSTTGQIGYAAIPTVTAATVDQINTPDNTTVFIRPDELEQSKHTTHNIYNNLNFI